MKVKVFAPPFLDHSKLDDKGFLLLEDNAVLSDVFRAIKAPLFLRPLFITSVNHKKAERSSPLKDGDVISIFWPVSGG